MSDLMEEIHGEVILDAAESFKGVYKYSAIQWFTDGSYILNVLGASDSIKSIVKKHVEDLHIVRVSCITAG